jgi:hypothetical protein
MAVERGGEMGWRRRRRKSYTTLYWHIFRLSAAVPQMRQVGKQEDMVRGWGVGERRREVGPHGHLSTTNSCVMNSWVPEEEEEAWRTRRHKVSILKSLFIVSFTY